MGLNDFRSLFLPYCIMNLGDKKYVVLNREYKPLGFNTIEHITYENYPIVVRFKRLTPKMISKISYEGNTKEDAIYLYNDSCVPTESKENMKKYLMKLELLSELIIK